MIHTRTIILFVVIAALSACGGGGGSSNPIAGNDSTDTVPTPTPTPSPNPSPTLLKWSATPTVLNTTDESIYEPHLAYDQAGNGLAIWVSVASNRNISILSSRYSASDSLWSSPTPIYANAYAVRYLSGPGQEYWESTTGLAMADNGDAWAVWTVSDSTAKTTVMTSHFDQTSLTWSTPEPLNADVAKDAHSVRVATNGNGQTVATWLEVDAQDNYVIQRDLLGIYASIYSDVSGWSVPVKLDNGSQEYYSPGTIYDYSPQPVVESNGKIVVVWHHGAGLWTAEYSMDSWSSALRIDDGSNTSSKRELNVALDALDNVHAVWVVRDGSNDDRVQYSRLDAGNNTWLTPVSIEAVEGDAYAPKVAANDQGRVVVAWLTGSTSSRDLYATQFDPLQDQWLSPEVVAPGVALSKQPVVAIDNDDNALILWQYVNLWYVHYTPTGNWERKVSVASGRHGMHFSLFPDAAGTLNAIWAFVESGVPSRLYVSSYQ